MKNILLPVITNIEFLGYKSGHELSELIRHASFVIVPSEWYENNPLTILEAYSHGKPVIGSRIGGIPEIIVEGKTGFLFEAGNQAQLKRCAGKSRFAFRKMIIKKCQMAARDFAGSHFNPDTHYNELMNIYKELGRINITYYQN